VEPLEPELAQDQAVVQDQAADQAVEQAPEQADIMVTMASKHKTHLAELKI
jgi:hypothetical protein